MRSIDLEHPKCRCESVSLSVHSPRPVSPDEKLLVAVYHPIHIEDSGELKNSVLSTVKSVGMSCFRQCYVTKEAFSSHVVQQESKGGRRFRGVMTIRADCVREICIDRDGSLQRVFCIYDTALRDNRSHAEVCQTGNPNNSTAKAARERLRQTISFRRFGSINEAQQLMELHDADE